MKKIKGQDHMLAYITPGERDMLVDLGGQETMTKEGILAYPPGGGDWGGSMSESGGGSGNKGAGGGGIDKGNKDYGQFGRAVARTANNPTTSTPSGDNNIDVGFQEALRKAKIEEKKQEARNKGGFRTTGSVKYSPPSAFQNFRDSLIESSLERNKRLALQKMGLINKPGFTGFTTSIIDAFTGNLPDWAKGMTEEELNELASDVQGIKDYGKATYNPGLDPDKKGSGSELLGRVFDAQDILDSGQMTQTKYNELFPGVKPADDRGGENSGITQALPLWAQLGFNSEAEYLASLNPATTTPTPSTRNFGGLAPRFAGSIFDFTGMAEGGRAGFKDGLTVEDKIDEMIDFYKEYLKKGGKMDFKTFAREYIPENFASGGRAGFQTGGSSGVSMQNTLAQNIAANNAQAVANQKARGAISALLSSKISKTSPATTTASMPSPSSMASTPSTSPMASTSFTSPQSSSSPSLSQMTTPPNVPSGTGGFTVNTPTGPATFSGPGYFGSQGVMLDGKIYYSEEDAIKDLGIERYNQLMADGGRAGYMDGGMIEDEYPMGGIMDLESIRDEYFVGGLVKSAKKAVKGVTRAVKKVAKSPIGKAALLYGLGAMGGSYGLTGKLFSKGMLNPMNMRAGLFGANSLMMNKLGMGEMAAKKGLFGKLGLTSGYGGLMPTLKGGLTVGLGIPAALDYFGVGKEEEEDDFDVDEYYRTQGIDIDAIRNSPYRFLAPRMVGSRFEQADGGRTGYQEGGDAEPVAKKTMPLLDMDGKEKDYRETGGFVDMGRMERADDVPARLSKNEFVFTADAVRNAGEGDVDKGAEVMYNMMKNLEAGGEVSEESQGLEGAREMFQTSQRLGEVI